MKLTEQQTKIANNLLDLVCKSKQIDGQNMYSLFESRSDAEYVCSILESNKLLRVNRVDQGITSLLYTELTCDCVANDRLTKELMQQEQIDSKAQLETEILKLQKDSLEYQLTIRGQQDRIRNLEEQIKTIELLKGYWWVLLICLGIGTYIGTLLDKWLQ
jgi:hypothetical protein